MDLPIFFEFRFRKKEKAEEDKNMTRVLNKLKLIKGDGAGLFMIDSELAQRVYVPAVIPS